MVKEPAFKCRPPAVVPWIREEAFQSGPDGLFYQDGLRVIVNDFEIGCNPGFKGCSPCYMAAETVESHDIERVGRGKKVCFVFVCPESLFGKQGHLSVRIIHRRPVAV